MKKTKLITTLECPNCKNLLDIIKEENVITPAIPAEKEEKYFAKSLGIQKHLDEA